MHARGAGQVIARAIRVDTGNDSWLLVIARAMIK